MKQNAVRILSSRLGGPLRIGTKIFVLVGLLLALLGTVSGISLWQMNKIGVEIEEIAKRVIPLTRELTEITIHQLEQAVNFERAFRAGEVMNKHSRARREFDNSVRTFKELTGKIEVEFGEVKVIARRAVDASIPEEERQQYQSVLTMLDMLDIEHKDYNRLSTQAFKLIDAGKLDQALALLPRIEAEEEDLDYQLAKMLREVEGFTQSEVNEIDEHEQFALKLLLAITGIALVTGTAASVYIVRRNISRPLSEITTGLEALGADDMSVEVKVHNNDEIGAVARAYAVFKQTLMKLKAREMELRESQAELINHRDHLREMVNIATRELKEALGKEQKLNKLQREFVSMASHELRTPLTIIDGAAHRMKRQLDKNQLLPEDAGQKLKKINMAVQRMTRLMDSTLAAARMQDGKIDIEIGPCDIRHAVREVCARQQEIAESHIISCDLAEIPATIQADSSFVEQILANLLSNAVKYAPDAPDIEVTARLEGHQVVISVSDHGIGIDEDDLDRIGERFFRAKTSTGIAGTGIGLNLVKTLVEMHDGTVNAVSKKGEGSTFTVRLPIAGPDQSQQADTKVA